MVLILVCNSIYQRKKKTIFFSIYIDYTLARYKPSLHSLIYDNAKTFLVKTLRVRFIVIIPFQKQMFVFSLKYPDDLMNFCYRPGMAARGLHLDIKRGWLMKVDSYHNIQLGTVYQ